jgi:hypothetical protein
MATTASAGARKKPSASTIIDQRISTQEVGQQRAEGTPLIFAGERVPLVMEDLIGKGHHTHVTSDEDSKVLVVQCD